ncbi:MAG: hypothetical protein K6G73_12290 [Marinilabiliaceae bacterium]|nr:hypothetical protein [Marinilabiliaceae bacterium]
MKTNPVVLAQKRILKAIKSGKTSISDIKKYCKVGDNTFVYAVAFHGLVYKGKITAIKNSDGVYQSFSINK